VIAVPLTDNDLVVAHRAAMLRVRRARETHAYNRYDARGDIDALNVTGCLGELAVARYLRAPWVAATPRFAHQPTDVAHVQVRTTPLGNGRLLVHPADPDDQPFVLARTHRAPVVELVGWILGADAKRDDWWRALQPGRPCYVVPNGALAPLDTLPGVTP